MKLSARSLLSGVATAVLLSGAAAWAQTETETGAQTQQEMQTQGAQTGTEAQTGSEAGTQQELQTQEGAQTGTEAQQPEMQTQEQQQQQQQETSVDVDVTAEQQTIIRQEIRERSVEPVTEVDFNIFIGAIVPGTIALHVVPEEIVRVVPEFSGYQYFVLPDGRIVIVEPGTLRVVLILD